jgi:ComF family protein
VLNLLLELLFPTHCTNCGRLGKYLCQRCYQQAEFLVNPDLTPQLSPKHLDQVLALAPHQPPWSHLVHQLKYNSVKNISTTIAEQLYFGLMLPRVDLVTSVPLHAKRKSERGFNQAEQIALHLARRLDVPYLPILERTLYTTAQAKQTNRQHRLNNLENAFQLSQVGDLYLSHLPSNFFPSCLIVDDVITTGSTLEQSAQVLQQSGAFSKVYGVALTHGHQ